jgi:uncharacterized protein YbjT (DUF2867 family)
MIFVTGATGRVGRHVVRGLLDRRAPVRALTRDPDGAQFPEAVDAVVGDLAEPERLAPYLDGVEAVFLLWPFLDAENVERVVDVIAAPGRRIVYLSAEAAGRRPDAVWGQVERTIEGSASEWTFLRATGFAANTLMWAEQIRDAGVVRWVYGNAARSLIHERDIASVAVRALTEQRHAGERYVVTGPEAVTQIEQVQAIGVAIGRTVCWQEIPREEVAQQLHGVPDSALDTWASFAQTPEVVTSTVEDVTGQPARRFLDWARDHADAFR